MSNRRTNTNRRTTTTRRQTASTQARTVRQNNSRTSRTETREARDSRIVLRDGIMTLLSGSNNTWSGTMTDLSRKLGAAWRRSDEADTVSLYPARLGAVLREALPVIRARGVSVKFYRSGHESAKMVKFVKNS